jgi:hypothetical protein
VRIVLIWGQRKAKYFRAQGLDDPNQLEMLHENRVLAHAIFVPFGRGERSGMLKKLN